jgi:hypothetical protein
VDVDVDVEVESGGLEASFWDEVGDLTFSDMDMT